MLVYQQQQDAYNVYHVQCYNYSDICRLLTRNQSLSDIHSWDNQVGKGDDTLTQLVRHTEMDTIFGLE